MKAMARTWTWPTAPFDEILEAHDSANANEKNHVRNEFIFAEGSLPEVSAPESADLPQTKPAFHHQRESSEIELFYDLFFVANLATVTINNEIVDATSK